MFPYLLYVSFGLFSKKAKRFNKKGLTKRKKGSFRDFLFCFNKLDKEK